MSTEEVMWEGSEGNPVEAIYINGQKFVPVPERMENPTVVDGDRLDEVICRDCGQPEYACEYCTYLPETKAYLQRRDECKRCGGSGRIYVHQPMRACLPCPECQRREEE